MFWNIILTVFGIAIALYGLLSLVGDLLDFFCPIKSLHPAVVIKEKQQLSSLEEMLLEAEKMSKNKVNYVLLLLSKRLLENQQIPQKVIDACKRHGADCLMINFEEEEEKTENGKGRE